MINDTNVSVWRLRFPTNRLDHYSGVAVVLSGPGDGCGSMRKSVDDVFKRLQRGY